MDLSIIIVNWNSKDFVCDCLMSIIAHPPSRTYEIVVVDSGSFDGCGEMLAEEFPEIIFVQSEQNIGFARANNLGFEHASGEAVWFLNPDTEVLAGAADTLLFCLHNLPDAGIFGARLLNTDGSLQASCVQALPTVLNQTLDCELLRRLSPHSPLWGMSPLWSAIKSVEAEGISGASLMLRSEVFRKVGRFTEQYFMYGEDMDLCFKLRKANHKNYYVPSSQVVHHGGGSSKKERSTFSDVMMRESVYRFMQMNRGRWSAASYRAGMCAAAMVRVAMLLMAGLVFTTYRGAPLRKWIAILRWAVGMESWAHRLPSAQALSAAPATHPRASVPTVRSQRLN